MAESFKLDKAMATTVPHLRKLRRGESLELRSWKHALKNRRQVWGMGGVKVIPSYRVKFGEAPQELTEEENQNVQCGEVFPFWKQIVVSAES